MNDEKDCTSKLTKFIILLGQLRREQALKMLPEFSNQSYYNHLDSLMQNMDLISILQNEMVRYRGIVMRLKDEVSRLNDRLAQQGLKQRPSSMSEQHRQMIEVGTYLQANQLKRAMQLSKMHKMNQTSTIIQQLQQYRWLKQQIHHHLSQNQTLPISFSSLEGESLKRLVTVNSSRYTQTIAFFKSQLHMIIQNLPLSELPSNLFDEDFKVQYEAFVANLRIMKNTLQDYDGPIKEKIIAFGNKYGFEINVLAGVNECVDRFLEKIEGLLERPQTQKIFFKRSIASASENYSSSSEYESSFSQQIPSKIQVQFPLRWGKSRVPIFKPEIDQKLEQMSKIICLHLPAIPNFSHLTTLKKIEQLVKKVKELGDEVEKVKLNDEQFVKSIKANRYSLVDGRSSLLPTEDTAPILLNQKSSEETALVQLKMMADRLSRELEEERTKRVKGEEFNSNLLIKLKNYPVKQNESLIQFNFELQRGCKATIADLQNEIQIQKEIIHKLKQDLSEKSTIITNFEFSRSEQRKKFQIEKKRLIDAEKAKLRKMRSECDDLMDQVTKLNNLYEERVLFSQRQMDSSHSHSYIHGAQRERMKQQLIMLSNQNQSLKQQLNRKTHQMGTGMSQESIHLQNTPQNSQSSESLIRQLNLESRIHISCNIKQYQDRISELEFKNELLANQLEKKDLFYNAYLDSQARDCSELKEVAATLYSQKEQLTSRLRLIQIRNIIHNEQNLPKLHLFPPGFIFEDYDYQERLFLLQNLQSFTGPIRRTRLLYRADPHNRANLHKYVDKHRHVVAIFKTIYGKLIAGYSQQAFDASGIIRGHGMIISLWGRKVFELKEKKAISYDDYFLIFGNSELRVKTGEFRLFSNFGIANAYYNNRGEKVHSVIGEEKEREVDLSHFEVYALDLQQ